ncbi:ATP-dependent DNA helicase RecG [Parvularcula marina]|uniref:ATP-dependent DNA helicase RecG n=1 Tax=Parvularcula marina TaxID=2292771 RepID=A0A371RKK9_9PROT|nr:ATP-dependent DNA helicase RecG [Parvularcula marina]RFB06005.1 ATP-dependent DNA helicase RecG [Parvularcula marina]
MRPSILNPLFADVSSLRGVGPKIAALMSKLAGPRIIDLLLQPPVGFIDRSYRPKLADAEPGRVATVEVRIDKHQAPPGNRKSLPYKIICSDETGFLTLVYFHARADWLVRSLPEGSTRLISGKIDLYDSERQITHPDYVASADEGGIPPGEAVYPLTAGLTAAVYRKAIGDALTRVPDLPEWLSEEEAALLPAWKEAIRTLHNPISSLELSHEATHRQRLAYDELLSNQLALGLIRHRRQKMAGRSLMGDGSLTKPARKALPFALTGDQEKVLTEIEEDMSAPSRMVRLVQGDVGSGKTMVALLAMLRAVEAGAQAALMAPTEILAQQHYETIAPYCDKLGLTTALVLGRDKGPARAATRSGIAKGYVQMVIGTHALFSSDVEFSDLGLVVVDEQHRFGVSQRLSLQDKGRRADVLVMTATPIPRTLALTTYGDMEVSQIREKPPGRKPVTTRALPLERIEDVISAIGRALEKGDQVYWVCPLVADTEMLDLTSVESRTAALTDRFGDRVGMVHGQMKAEEKDAVIEAFSRGEIAVLVATTVIEVGVNTPNATVMVIEHAERFGLAQLHQLRGRVGRGEKPSSCLLLYSTGESGVLGETAKARLNILRETEDGFRIAEEDLLLRGPGDALGTAQSGLPDFTIADLGRDGRLLEKAAATARTIIEEDPDLETKKGAARRLLLYLYGQDDAVKRLRAG